MSTRRGGLGPLRAGGYHPPVQPRHETEHPQDSAGMEHEIWTCDLPRAMPAADDCLPHAAMGLGSSRAVGTSPHPAMVHRVVVQKQLSAWCCFRLDDGGGYVNESWHPDRDDAIRTACREFGLKPEQFRPGP